MTSGKPTSDHAVEALPPAAVTAAAKDVTPARARRFAGQRNALIGVGVLVMLGVLTALAPWVLPSATSTDAVNTLQPPSADHWFGTDRFGRDVLSRTLNAIRLDLGLAIVVALTALAIGTVMGALAGYFGGWVDEVIMRFTDILAAFPGFVLALVITLSLGNSTTNAVIGVTVASIPSFVRLTRASALSERELDYVRAARISGTAGWRIALSHVLPNSIRSSVVQVSFVAGWAILNIAGLAFLGVGVQAPTAEWGIMVSDGSTDIVRGYWWTSVFPGMFILLAASAFHLIGDAYEEKTR